MALYDFNKDQVNFLRTMVTKVVPQGTREEIKMFIAIGDTVLESLNKPILPAGKSKEERGIRKLTDEELKVVNESCTS